MFKKLSERRALKSSQVPAPGLIPISTLFPSPIQAPALTLLLALALAGCATGRSPGQVGGITSVSSTTPSTGTTIEGAPPRVAAPREVAGYTIADSVRYPQAEAGTLYRYRGGGPLEPDLFIYPRSASESVKTDAEDFRVVLAYNRDRGLYDSFRFVLDHEWSPVSGIPGHEIITVLSRGGDERNSYYYIFVVHDKFVKLRLTQRPDQAEADQVRAFVTTLLQSLSG